MKKRHHQDTKALSTLNLKWSFRGLALILAFTVIIVTTLIFLLPRLFYRDQIANLLPADSTLAFAEFDLDSNSPQVQQFQKIFANHPYLSSTALNQISHNFIPQFDQIEPWFGGRLGLAVLAQPNHQNPILIALIKVNNRELAQAYINSSAQNQNFHLVNNQNYLLFSEQPQALESIQKAIDNPQSALKNQPIYNQVYSALPQPNLAFIYFNSNKIFASLAANPNFLQGKLAIFQKYLPFLSLFSADGLALYADNSQQQPVLSIQQLSLFDQSKLPSSNFFHNNYHLAGNLISLLPSDALFLSSSSHLQDQKDRLQKLFANHSTVQELLFAGNLEQIKQNLLGQNLNLDEDFFPLFENEFAFSIDSLSKPGFSLALQLKSDQDQQKIEKILLILAKQAALESSVKKEVFILPDSTKGQQIVAHPTEPAIEQISIVNQAVKKISFTNTSQLSLYFTVIDNILLASTNQTKLQNMLSSEPKLSTSNQTQFFQDLNNISEYYDFHISSILNDFGLSQFDIYSKPFSHLAIGRKFTEIGLLSIYRLE